MNKVGWILPQQKLQANIPKIALARFKLEYKVYRKQQKCPTGV